MKKTLSLILAGLMLTAVLAACGGESEDSASTTTTAPVTTTVPATTTKATENEPATNEPATSEPATSEPATSEPATSEPATNEPATSEPATNEPATNEPAVNASLTWYDNNEQLGKQYYDITVNADGSVHVAYTKQTAAEAESSWGYSWANMAADISEVYTGQTKFVLKVQGEAGKNILVKPFDSQSFEKTVELDGSVQTFTFTLTNVPADAARSIIIFGEGGAVDTSGEFTILDAYFE